MNLSPVFKQRFFDANGLPLAGGQLFSYVAGTTTPQVTYKNSTGTTNTNPVILDASGYADVWLDPSIAYKLVLEDSLNNVLWSVDNVSFQNGISPWNANSVYAQGSIVQDSSGQGLLYVSLTNGNTNQALTNVSAWRLFNGNIRTVSTNSTLAVTDDLIRSNSTTGNLLHTLPPCASTPLGKKIAVKDIGTGGFTTSLKGSGSDNIDGNNTFSIPLNKNGSLIVENNGSSWDVISYLTTSTSTINNSLLNCAFDSWQRGTTITVPYNATKTFTYGPDRWAGLMGMNASGTLTLVQVSGTMAGSVFGLSAKVGTAPGGGSSTGAQVVQVLDSVESLLYSGQQGSFSTNIKALGNVNAVSLQFFSMANQTSVAQNLAAGLLGSPVSVAVNSSGFVVGKISGQLIGTLMGTAGCVGVLISASGVSSGNVSDANNGFVLEQCMMNVGSTPATFQRPFVSQYSERSALQAYFEKSFDWNTVPFENAPGASQSAAYWFAVSTTPGICGGAIVSFKTNKRATPSTLKIYNPSPVSGTSGRLHDFSNGNDQIPNNTSLSTTTFVVGITSGPVGIGDQLGFNWTADAEIY